MKKLFLGILSIGFVHFCTAQTKTKEKVVFTPPVIKKDEPTNNDEVKFTPPIIKRNKPAKAKEKVKFTPPVIAKDKMK